MVMMTFQDHLYLGICLGHQSIALSFGAEIIRAKNMMHGKTSQIEVEKDTLRL